MRHEVDPSKLKTRDFGLKTLYEWQEIDGREKKVFAGYEATRELKLSLPLDKEFLSTFLEI